jgi:hypothetical protein
MPASLPLPARLWGLVPTLTLALVLAAVAMPAWSDTQDDEQDAGRDLRIAAMIDDTEAVATLLDQGADVNAASRFGKTALMFAVEGGNLQTAALLLNRGADVNARTVAG